MSYKVLVVSDSHRKVKDIEKALANMGPHMDMMIHLGDSELPENIIRELTDKPVEMVRGNCDYSSSLPEAKVVDIKGHKIFITHGHKYACSAFTDLMKNAARENGAETVMYGHTHVPYMKQEDDIMVINPGSISVPRQSDGRKSYLVMTVEDNGRVDYMHVYLD